MLPADTGNEEFKQLRAVADKLQNSQDPILTRILQFDNGWVCPRNDACNHPKTPPGLFFTPVMPADCIRGKLNAVANADAYDLTLALHNICSGSLVCKVVTDQAWQVMLRPDQQRDLVLQRGAKTQDIKYGVDCEFL